MLDGDYGDVFLVGVIDGAWELSPCVFQTVEAFAGADSLPGDHINMVVDVALTAEFQVMVNIADEAYIKVLLELATNFLNCTFQRKNDQTSEELPV